MLIRIFPTGKALRNKSQGFTLIELLMIIFIIGVFSTFLTLRLEGFFSVGLLRQTAEMIANDIKILKSKATYTKMDQKIIFDIDKNSYHIIIKNTSIVNNTSTLNENLINPVITKMLPEGIDVTDIKLHSNDIKKNGLVEILFFADGSAQEAVLHMKDEKDKKITLKINPSNGDVTIHDTNAKTS